MGPSGVEDLLLVKCILGFGERIEGARERIRGGARLPSQTISPPKLLTELSQFGEDTQYQKGRENDDWHMLHR